MGAVFLLASSIRHEIIGATTSLHGANWLTTWPWEVVTVAPAACCWFGDETVQPELDA